MPEPLLDITLPLAISNNNTGRGNSFWNSQKRRTEYENKLRLLGYKRDPFTQPVAVTITRILAPRQRLWDYDSVLRGSAKELLDALVAVGWFFDDSPKWITACDGRQDDTQRPNGPATRVQVWTE